MSRKRKVVPNCDVEGREYTVFCFLALKYEQCDVYLYSDSLMVFCYKLYTSKNLNLPILFFIKQLKLSYTDIINTRIWIGPRLWVDHEFALCKP